LGAGNRIPQRLSLVNSTSASLLERLRQPNEQLAWERFVQLYTPLLCQWARHLGFQAQDEADLVQDVFTVLVRKLPEFRHDPNKRFRGWLWTVTANKARERRRRVALPGQAGPDLLAELPAREDAEAISETEYREYLVRRALEVMQAEFQPATWKAFWECVTNERPAAAVAAELDMSIDAVYAAKSRVLRRLRRELEGLLD
jgi:RNA polymerase sigma-70 factor (ECF subfamily)